jgi:hypothetical protein
MGAMRTLRVCECMTRAIPSRRRCDLRHRRPLCVMLQCGEEAPRAGEDSPSVLHGERGEDDSKRVVGQW